MASSSWHESRRESLDGIELVIKFMINLRSRNDSGTEMLENISESEPNAVYLPVKEALQ